MSRGRHRKPTHTGRNLAVVSASGAFALPLTLSGGAPAAAAEPSRAPAGILDSIAQCESSGNPKASNGTHFGLFQFDLPTWRSVGGTGNPMNASVAEQYSRAAKLLAMRGTQPWDASQSCHGRSAGAGTVDRQARAKAPQSKKQRQAPTTSQKRAAPKANTAGVTGRRGADGTGSYVCAPDKLHFEACDPGNLGQVVNYPRYNGHGSAPVTGKQVASHHTTAPASSNTSAIATGARAYLGVPYVWGGANRGGMDCSGLTYRVLRDLGYSPPRTALAQSKWATPISAAEARPGDLVFHYSPVSHVGIYLGQNRMIDASQPGTSISVHNVYPGVTKYGRVPS